MRTTNLIIAIATFEQMCVRRVSECWYMCKWRQYVYSYVIVYINIILDWPKFSSFHLSLSVSLSLSLSLACARALGLLLCISLPALYASTRTNILCVLFASYERCELFLCLCLRSSGFFFTIKRLLPVNWFLGLLLLTYRWKQGDSCIEVSTLVLQILIRVCALQYTFVSMAFSTNNLIRPPTLDDWSTKVHQMNQFTWKSEVFISFSFLEIPFPFLNNYMYIDTRVFNEMKTRATTMCTIARSWCLSWTATEDLSDERKETNTRSKMKKHTEQRDNHTRE